MYKEQYFSKISVIPVHQTGCIKSSTAAVSQLVPVRHSQTLGRSHLLSDSCQSHSRRSHSDTRSPFCWRRASGPSEITHGHTGYFHREKSAPQSIVFGRRDTCWPMYENIFYLCFCFNNCMIIIKEVKTSLFLQPFLLSDNWARSRSQWAGTENPVSKWTSFRLSGRHQGAFKWAFTPPQTNHTIGGKAPGFG